MQPPATQSTSPPPPKPEGGLRFDTQGLDDETAGASGSEISSASDDMPIVKLSPALKQLLKSRFPDPLPGPSASALNGVFKSTFEELSGRDVPAPTGSGSFYGGALYSWLVVTTATLLTTNTPSTISHLYRFAISQEGTTLSDKAERLAVMREAGLKCSVLVGIPKTINSLGALREATESEVIAEVQKLHGSSGSEDAVNIRDRGNSFFDTIYTPHTQKLLRKLGESHPDFPDFIVDHAYGALLSRPLVSRTLTSALAIACLRAQGRVGPQLTSHVFGLLKAGTEEEGKQTPVEKWLSSPEGTEWVISTVDRLCDVVSSPDEQSRL